MLILLTWLAHVFGSHLLVTLFSAFVATVAFAKDNFFTVVVRRMIIVLSTVFI